MLSSPLKVVQRSAGSRIPLWIKLAYSGFLCILVPYYWHDYGPTNFLYFCDVALFLALAAVWSEKGLWASMGTVGIRHSGTQPQQPSADLAATVRPS